VWFRRDLRDHDHAALFHALTQSQQIYAAFVFDTDILNGLPRQDRRVEFIRDSVAELHEALQRHSNKRSGLIVLQGRAVEEIPRLAQSLGVQAVMTHHDDEPAALQRDTLVSQQLAEVGIALHTFKDHVIFERDEIMTAAHTPFSVFTSYKNAWLKKIDDFYLRSYTTPGLKEKLALLPEKWQANVPSLNDLGFEITNLKSLKILPGMSGAEKLFGDFVDRIDDYEKKRDFPALKGPSYLSVHLRFGTLSIRRAVRMAWDRMQAGSKGAQTWLSELVWRDFFMQVLHHHPHVVDHAFRPAFDSIEWEKGDRAKKLFQAWCEGRTGYPLVDAAMAQINQTGYMHNRLRMVTASFLVKDLGIDWRWGERYFAEKLNDYDLASNNGGWQWSASTGCDAQPYFRIFNPVMQSEKFDSQGKFIRRYLPQLAKLPEKFQHAPWKASADTLKKASFTMGVDYPHPIIDHEVARKKTLERFEAVKAIAD
jgi:deoxyribodipyrimidine photo-lyase